MTLRDQLKSLSADSINDNEKVVFESEIYNLQMKGMMPFCFRIIEEIIEDKIVVTASRRNFISDGNGKYIIEDNILQSSICPNED
ncbi:hypothetical protein NXH64_00925 [Butyrivibrio fibrisolvens]|uniref:hypothetical protein n=1 Tax=Pseudobutyrivibrio ruminis TaxID=46206 RepID=UPI0003FB7EEC|nr:hypothetical protein [Pseudobutyrivibrio ruminis]MDC7278054.1 hypothetical protein [Butyrivibrio fibrisolvens]